MTNYIIDLQIQGLPIPAAAWSKVWVCGTSPAETLGSNPTGGMNVCCECCVSSGRGFCDELNTRPEESYRLVVCGNLVHEEALAH
jgi:hypothetical protein